jgi:hypothetical protein
MQSVPVEVSSGIAKRLGIAETLHPRFHKHISVVVQEAWRNHGVARKAGRQADVTIHLDRLLRVLEALLPENGGEIAGVFLGATLAPDTIEDWIEKVERARHNATKNPSTKLPSKRPRTPRPGFNIFLALLLGAERKFQCRWTIGYDAHNEVVSGTLVHTLNDLRPHLPPDFLPTYETLRRDVQLMRSRDFSAPNCLFAPRLVRLCNRTRLD